MSVASCIISYGLQTVAFWGIDLIDAVLLRGSIANDPDRRRSRMNGLFVGADGT